MIPTKVHPSKGIIISPSKEQVDHMWEEVFNVIPGAIYVRRSAATLHVFALSSGILTTHCNHLRISLLVALLFYLITNLIMLDLHHPRVIYINSKENARGRQSIPADYEEIRVAFNSLPTMTSYPARIGYQLVTQVFCKMWESRTNKLKGGYSWNTSLIFQLYLKDIQICIKDCRLMQWEATQLVKNFTTTHARDEGSFIWAWWWKKISLLEV